MKLKNNNTTRNQTVRNIFVEELAQVVKEEVEAGRLKPEDLEEKSTMGHLGSAAKGYGKTVSSLFHSFAKTLDQVMNKGMVDDEVGDKVEDKLEDIKDDTKSPEDFSGSVEELGKLMRALADQLEADGADGAADKIDDMADQADKVEDKIEGEDGDSDEDEGEISLKKLSTGQLRVALNQLGNKGLSAEKVGALFDKASTEIFKQAGPMANKFKEEDLPVINAVKDQVVAILSGDLNALKEQKIHPGTARFLAHFADNGVKNQNKRLINSDKVER